MQKTYHIHCDLKKHSCTMLASRSVSKALRHSLSFTTQPLARPASLLMTRSTSPQQQNAVLSASEHPGTKVKPAPQLFATLISLGSAVSMLSLAAPAFAEDTAADVAQAATSGGFNPGEVALVVAPILFYGLFSVYRERVNPKATLLDAAYILAALVVVFNIFSIVVFKVRYF